MNAAFAQRTRPARRLAALGALGLCVAGRRGRSGSGRRRGQAGAAPRGQDVTLRFYSVTASFVYTTRGRHRVAAIRRRRPSAGDKIEIIENALQRARTRSTPRRSSRRPTRSASSPRRSRRPPVTARARSAATRCCSSTRPAGGDTVVSGGTGRYLGATGTRRHDRDRQHEQLRPRDRGAARASDARGRASRQQPRSGDRGCCLRRRGVRRSAHGRLPRRQPCELGRPRRGARRLAGLRRLALQRGSGLPERRRERSTCRGWATSRASTPSTCSATSAPTPSRSRGSAPA